MGSKYACLCFAVLIIACGKNRSDSSAAPKHPLNRQIDSAASHPTNSMVPDGFYINKNYRNALDLNKSIFNIDRPYGPLTIRIQGDSATLDYNGEVLQTKVAIWGELKQLENGAECLARVLNDSTILFWDNSSKTAHQYVNARSLKGDINNLTRFYQAHLFDGKYLCEGSSMCIDTVEINADTIKGMQGGPHGFEFGTSWNDNYPRMDYLIVDDSIGYGYLISLGDLVLFDLVISKDCENIRDTQCPMFEAKQGKHAFTLKKIEPEFR